MAAPADIATKIKEGALRELGVLAAGESLGADDDTLAETTLDQLIADLGERRIVYFDQDSLPDGDEATRPLIALLASDLAGKYGVSDTKERTLLAKAGAAAVTLRESAVPGRSGDTTPFINY